jgi:hypothetical protein
MCPGTIVIFHIQEEYVAQVPLAEYDDVIKTFPPDRANQLFCMPILPWRAWRSWPVSNTHGAKPTGKNFGIDPVAIVNDIPR